MTEKKTLKEQCAERKAKRLKERGLDRTDLEKKRDQRRKARERYRKKVAAQKEARRAKTEGYKGNKPNAKNGWYLVMRLEPSGYTPWDIWRRRYKEGDVWVNFKVVSLYRVPNKANYWLGYSIAEHRWGPARIVQLLQAQRPKIWDAVRKLVEDR